MIQVGAYTVHLRQAPGHQCPLYCVYLGDVLIGKSISMPAEDDCRWLEQQQRQQTMYAYSGAPLPELSTGRRTPSHIARSRKVGAPRKQETLQDIKKALVGG